MGLRQSAPKAGPRRSGIGEATDSEGQRTGLAQFLAEVYFHKEGLDDLNEDAIMKITRDNGLWDQVSDGDELFGLRTKKSDDGRNVLMAAAAAGHGKIVSKLLRSVNETTAQAMVTACCNGRRSALAYAAIGGNFDAFTAIRGKLVDAREMFDQLVQVDTDKLSVLSFAVKHAKIFTEVRQMYLAYPELYDKEIYKLDEPYRPLLLLAAAGGVKEVYNQVEADLKIAAVRGAAASAEGSAPAAEDAMLLNQLRNWKCNKRNSLMAAAAGGDSEIFQSVLDSLGVSTRGGSTNADVEKIKVMLQDEDRAGRTALMLAAAARRPACNRGERTVFDMVVELLETLYHGKEPKQQIRRLMCATDKNGYTILMHACAAHNSTVVDEVLNRLPITFLALDRAGSDGDTALNKCKGYTALNKGKEPNELMRKLLSYGATPNRKFFEECSSFEDSALEDLFMDAIIKAENPLVPCLTLSGALAITIKKGGRNRQMWLALRKLVDKVTAAILDVLPRDANQMEGGWVTAGYMLEPERLIRRSSNFLGPLEAALTQRHLDFLSAPMVVDYVGLQLRHGMVSIFDFSGHTYRRPEVLRYFQDPREDKFLGMVGTEFTAINDTAQKFTYLPGHQFILAGLATRPEVLYRAPSMRLAMNALSFIGVLVLYNNVVVLKDKEISACEAYFWTCAFGMMLTEVRQLQYQGWTRHFADQWNYIDATYAVLLFCAFVARMSEGKQALFCAQLLLALSGPLLWYRLLSLAQLHRRLGPMVQVINLMLKELATFMVVLGVVMMGFTVAFVALFSPSGVIRYDKGAEGYRSYDTAVLTLFSAMLGNFEFEVFDGVQHGLAGTVLLCTYLTVMAIMLLNLLIAVLAAAYTAVMSNINKEFQVSQTFLFMESIKGAEMNLLPTPFNILQEVLSLFGLILSTKEVLGKLIFTFFMGAIGVIGSMVLWALSLPTIGIKHVAQCSREMDGEYLHRIVPRVIMQFWLYLLKVPSHCLVMWLRAIFTLCGDYLSVVIKQLPSTLHRIWLTIKFAVVTCAVRCCNYHPGGSGSGSSGGGGSGSDDGQQQGSGSSKNLDGLLSSLTGSLVDEPTVLMRASDARLEMRRSLSAKARQNLATLTDGDDGDEAGDSWHSASAGDGAEEVKAEQKRQEEHQTSPRSQPGATRARTMLDLSSTPVTKDDDLNRELCKVELAKAFSKRGSLEAIIEELRWPGVERRDMEKLTETVACLELRIAELLQKRAD